MPAGSVSSSSTLEHTCHNHGNTFREPRTRGEPTEERERACTEKCMKQSERDVNTTMAGVGRVGAMKVVMGRRGGGGEVTVGQRGGVT